MRNFWKTKGSTELARAILFSIVAILTFLVLEEKIIIFWQAGLAIYVSGYCLSRGHAKRNRHLVVDGEKTTEFYLSIFAACMEFVPALKFSHSFVIYGFLFSSLIECGYYLSRGSSKASDAPRAIRMIR